MESLADKLRAYAPTQPNAASKEEGTNTNKIISNLYKAIENINETQFSSENIKLVLLGASIEQDNKDYILSEIAIASKNFESVNRMNTNSLIYVSAQQGSNTIRVGIPGSNIAPEDVEYTELDTVTEMQEYIESRLKNI